MNPLARYIKRFMATRQPEIDGRPGRSAGFHRTSALVMGGVALMLIILAIVLHGYAGHYSVLMPMVITGVLIMASIIWLYKNPFAKIPRFYNSIALALLGIFLIIDQGTLNGGGLLWFILTPPMLMFCLGLSLGAFVFMGFYFALMVLFLGPYSQSLLADSSFHLPRVFLLLFGIFLFSWVAEYVRHRTQEALALANRRLEREARTDTLTGLGNRREFEEQFSWLQAQSRRNNEPFAIAMADIDHFKRINDNYGHHTGDMVLQHVARLISGTLRAADRVFRWGGEEFIILLPSTTGQEGVFMAERLRMLVEDSPFMDGQSAIPLTISLGVYSGSIEQSLDEHVKQVDARMYAAKNCGRNQVCAGLFDLHNSAEPAPCVMG